MVHVMSCGHLDARVLATESDRGKGTFAMPHESVADDESPYPLRVTARLAGNAQIHQVTGEIDTLTAPYLSTALADVDDAARHVIVDLSDVPFLSSAGLSVLVDHHERCTARNVTFAVVARERATVRPIQLTALDRVIPLYESVAAAVAASAGDDQAIH